MSRARTCNGGGKRAVAARRVALRPYEDVERTMRSVAVLGLPGGEP